MFKKINEYKGIIIIVFIVLGGWFYWFQLRPIQIKKECSQYFTSHSLLSQDLKERKYKLCLIEKGL